MRKIRIAANVLASVLPFICKLETRYYLNGVWIEPCAAGGVIAVATDGHLMGIARDPKGSIEGGRGFINTISPAAERFLNFERSEFEDEDGGHEWSGRNLTGAVFFDDHLLTIVEMTRAEQANYWPGPGAGEFAALSPIIDGTYPDWRKVVPKDLGGGDMGRFNAEYAARINKAASLYTLNRTASIILRANRMAGPHPMVAQISGDTNFVALMMPMTDGSRPTWTMPNYGWMGVQDLGDTAAGGDARPQPAPSAAEAAASENGRPGGEGSPLPAGLDAGGDRAAGAD